MSKKKKSKKPVEPELTKHMLPQNIIGMGEYVDADKNIYILQSVYKEIHKFTQNKTTNESGGMLVGTIVEEFSKTNIIISGFIEAKHCEATPTTLKFTHETWEYVHQQLEKKFPGKKIVGWIHTHPDFGIFLSEYDKFIQKNFFNEDYQVAYVVDPIQMIEGFYFWVNGSIERCKGFYIYDKTGAKITIDVEKTESSDDTIPVSFLRKNLVSILLSIISVALIFANISAFNQIKHLQLQQETLANSANQSLSYMQQQILSQDVRIKKLEEQLVSSEKTENTHSQIDNKSDSSTHTQNEPNIGTDQNSPPHHESTPAPAAQEGDDANA